MNSPRTNENLWHSEMEPWQYPLLDAGHTNSSYNEEPPTVSALPGWPATGKTLRESTKPLYQRLTIPLLLILIPVCFLVLGITIAKLHNTGESDAGQAAMQAMSVSATLWPIVFAAVLAPMLKTLALYRAERGLKLGVLEVISSSQSLVSTVRGLYALRIWTAWSAVLLILWAWSPLGGQAILRSMQLNDNTTSLYHQAVSYPINNLSSWSLDPFNSGVSGGGSIYNQFRAVLDAVFCSPDVALMHSNGTSIDFDDAVERAGGATQANKIAQMDIWHNVRVPFVHLLPEYDSDSPFSWTNVPADSVAPYSSLLGVPIRGVPAAKQGNSTMLIQTNYQTLSCSTWSNQTDWNKTMSDWYDYTGQPLYVSGIPNVWVGLKMDGEHRPPTRNLDDIEPTMKLNLFFTTRYNVTYCRISTAYVDAGVECSRASDNGALDCAVNKMRHSSGLPIEGNLTALDINLNVRVLNEMPYTLASQHPFEPSFLEQYLKDPPTAFQISYDMDKAWYEDLPLNVFENRLSMVLNTFLRSSLNITINFGNDGASLENRGSVWANATGKWSIYTTKVYQVDKTWIALFLAAALILTICAIINVILRSMIRVPDFLGSLSALTRDTPFIQAPASGSAMDGDDRSRLLRDKWVIIQDVQPNNETGRLAFTDERRTLPVSWDRKLI